MGVLDGANQLPQVALHLHGAARGAVWRLLASALLVDKFPHFHRFAKI